MNFKISVVVPVYNNELYLDKLIDSIEKQTYSNFEIVFVDDGSTDSSLSKIKQYSKKYNNISFFSQTNSGPGIARMNGFLKTNGDLLFFIDSDDYLPNNCIFEQINNIFCKYNPDVLFFDREEIFSDKVEIINFFNDFNISDGMHSIFDIPKMELHGGLGCKILKKSILSKDMFIKSYNYEDFFTTYNYLDKCNNFYYFNHIMYSINHLSGNNSLTTKLDINSLESCIDIVVSLYHSLNNQILKNSLLETCPGIVIFYSRCLLSNGNKNIDTNLKHKVAFIKKMIKENHVVYKPKKNVFFRKIVFKFLMFF